MVDVNDAKREAEHEPHFWLGERSRKIVKRIVVTCDLILETPAHFGNGDGDALTDMPLLVDPADDRTPLLTGASIAGALRAYLRTREIGFRDRDADKSNDRKLREFEIALFGGYQQDDEGEQSPLIIDDSFGSAKYVEHRHGVMINPSSRTAEHNKLYDMRLWAAGTTFPLRFELIIREGKDETQLQQALGTALTGLTDGSITLGTRKRRGFGKVTAANWRAHAYDLTTSTGLMDWLQHGSNSLAEEDRFEAESLPRLEKFDVRARQLFTLTATFEIDGSLLIRTGEGTADMGPDMVHLHARRNGKDDPVPVLSGTSLTGTLRARAFKIVNTLLRRQAATKITNNLFGQMDSETKTKIASRLTVEECEITGAVTNLVQNRVSIDRFTGGARDTALFNQQPAWGGELTITLKVTKPEDYEIGLILLLLKDLWTGDLPLGGESSVGRGRLKGISATLKHGKNEWTITADGENLHIPDQAREPLQNYVMALTNRVNV